MTEFQAFIQRELAGIIRVCPSGITGVPVLYLGSAVDDQPIHNFMQGTKQISAMTPESARLVIGNGDRLSPAWAIAELAEEMLDEHGVLLLRDETGEIAKMKKTDKWDCWQASPSASGCNLVAVRSEVR